GGWSAPSTGLAEIEIRREGRWRRGSRVAPQVGEGVSRKAGGYGGPRASDRSVVEAPQGIGVSEPPLPFLYEVGCDSSRTGLLVSPRACYLAQNHPSSPMRWKHCPPHFTEERRREEGRKMKWDTHLPATLSSHPETRWQNTGK
ncbi:unnamed protein product, partial [Gulo gulo]